MTDNNQHETKQKVTSEMLHQKRVESMNQTVDIIVIWIKTKESG